MPERPWQLQLGANQGGDGYLGERLCPCSYKFLTVILGFDFELNF